MAEEISREGAGQRIAYNVALHIGTKEIENVEMAKRKWAVSSRKAAGSGLQRSPSAEASGRGGVEKETGCPGDCFAFFAFIDELSIAKLYFRLLFLLSCGLFFSFQGYDIELQPGNGLKCPATAAAASSGSGSSEKKAKQLFQVVQLCARIKFLLQKSYKSACLISCRRRRLWKHIAVVASAEIGRIWRVKLKLCNFH